jgi:hypothetical protein
VKNVSGVKKLKEEDKTKAELIKELKTLRKKEAKSALNNFVEYKQNKVIKDSKKPWMQPLRPFPR